MVTLTKNTLSTNFSSQNMTPNMSTNEPPQYDAMPNPWFTGEYHTVGKLLTWDLIFGNLDDSPGPLAGALPPSTNWTEGGNGSSGVEESQGFMLVTIVTSIPSLLGIAGFSFLLVYIILKEFRDILEMYLSVLAYASSQVKLKIYKR